MNKKFLYVMLAVIIVCVFVLFFVKKDEKKILPNDNNFAIIFFYGETCPHCINVEKYFGENGVEDKVSFEKREVYKNIENAKLLSEKAKLCGIRESEVGVPLLWNDGKCLVGDQDIINFFNEKLNEKQ